MELLSSKGSLLVSSVLRGPPMMSKSYIGGRGISGNLKWRFGAGTLGTISVKTTYQIYIFCWWTLLNNAKEHILGIWTKKWSWLECTFKIFLENIFPKTLYLENGESDQKIFLNKKDAELDYASFLFRTLFCPIRRFWDIKLFLENIFQKTLYLENGESDQKIFLNKKDAVLNYAFFFQNPFLSDSPFLRY